MGFFLKSRRSIEELEEGDPLGYGAHGEHFRRTYSLSDDWSYLNEDHS